MKINAHPAIRGLMDKVEEFIDRRPGIARALRGCEVTIGPASDPDYMIPYSAQLEAAYVGDPHLVADAKFNIASEEVKQLYKTKPGAVESRMIYDDRMKQFRLQAQKKQFVRDWAGDAAPDLMAAQALSPWNVGWFQDIFQQPLLYSHFEELVNIESGTEPWAEVMNMQLADFAAFADAEDTGQLSNNATQDVNVQAGIMSSPVMNLTSSYSLAIEELKRSEQSSSPFGSKLVTAKQKYADYVLHIITAMLGYYGNVGTETVGLINVPAGGVTVYGGTSMNALFLAAGASVGSLMLSALQGIIVPFLDSLNNKAETLVLAMSPICYNRLTAPYSQLYNPTSALKAFIENFIAGKKEKGDVPDIEIVIEPLLGPTNALNPAGNPMNANAFDYLVLAAPKIRTGPEGQAQPMLMFGAPLMKFVYPTIPGSYNTQYKFLRRIAGVFCPVTAAVRVISGFGCLTAGT
jgi:hypothetical protein